MSRYVCKCGAIFAVPRSRNKRRPKGHIKTLWCYACKKRTPHRQMGR